MWQEAGELAWRRLAVAATLLVLTGCGGSGGPGVVLRLTPDDVLLAPGQVARFAVLADDNRTRQVTGAQWAIDDAGVATVAAGTNGTAAVTGLANGQTTLRVTVNGTALSAVVRVGLQSVQPATMADLASFATDAAGQGLITADSPVLPRELPASPALLAQLRADLGPPERPVSFRVNPAVFGGSPVVITAADLTLDGSATRAMTHDGTLELGVRLFLTRLKEAGFNVDPFLDALAHVHLHQAGASSGGIVPRTGVPAVTLFPGLRYYNSTLALITGEPSTTYDSETATAVRDGHLIVDGKLAEAGSTVLHELMHVSLEQRDLDSLDDDADTVVGLLEALMRAVADLALSSHAGATDPAALNRYFGAYSAIDARPDGAQVLDAFGQRKAPAASAINAPGQVIEGQTFTVQLTLSGDAGVPNTDVLVNIAGAATDTGSRVVRTNAAGRAVFTVQAASEEGVIDIIATYLSDRRTVHVAVVNPAHPGAYVVLDRNVALAGGDLPYLAGDIIFLSRINGGHVAGPEGGCSTDHLHGTITIDEVGPYADPNNTGCGFGRVFNAP